MTGDALAEGAAMPVQRGVEGLSSILTRVGALVYQAAAVRARGAVVELQGEEGSLDPDAVSEERALLWETTIAEQVGLPRRLWRASFRAGQPGQALGRAWTFLLEGEYHAGRCLVLAGPTGGGKTYAAAAALRHVGRTTLSFFYFPGVVNALLDQNERKEMLASLKHSRFIVLDDVGTEYRKQGGLVEALFDEVIWHREAQQLPTIITTNWTVAEMKAELSARIVDRLRSWGEVFAVTDKSYRSAL